MEEFGGFSSYETWQTHEMLTEDAFAHGVMMQMTEAACQRAASDGVGAAQSLADAIEDETARMVAPVAGSPIGETISWQRARTNWREIAERFLAPASPTSAQR